MIALAVLGAASAAQACVLVIVCDASTPLTAPEMSFIRETGAAVEALRVSGGTVLTVSGPISSST